jgi:hypothetical protein
VILAKMPGDLLSKITLGTLMQKLIILGNTSIREGLKWVENRNGS